MGTRPTSARLRGSGNEAIQPAQQKPRIQSQQENDGLPGYKLLLVREACRDQVWAVRKGLEKVMALHSG